MRRPNCDPPDVSKRLAEDGWTFRLRLATPMIGGGATAGCVDPHYPFRASEIRGHLRFWWRASVGWMLSSPESMHRIEDVLFGSTERPGGISIRVTDVQNTRVLTGQSGGIPTYVYNLPAQGNRELQIMQEGATFDLHLKLDANLTAAHEKFVVLTLRNFFRYGGIGSRTRRGCGSLEWPAPKEVFEKFEQLRKEATVALGSRPVEIMEIPRLRGAKLFVGQPANGARAAHVEAVNWYQCLRKGKPAADYLKTARGASGEVQLPHAGQGSHTTWPERRTIGAMPGGGVGLFPRAQMGLPIQFRFVRGDQPLPPAGEVGLDGSDRFASPLIIKAIPMGGQWRPMVLLLEGSTIGNRHVVYSVFPQGQTSTALDSVPDTVSPTREKCKSLGELVSQYATACGWEERPA